MNELIPFEFEDKQVRTIVINGEPWFVAKDVAGALGYISTAKAVRMHCKRPQPVGVTEMGTLDQQTVIIQEADVYRLIMRSRLPSAEQFEEWVSEEVLPTIRKTGGVYMTPQKTEELLADPDLIIGLAMQVKQIKLERDEAIRTKAYVAAGREGTLLSKVGHLTKQVTKLEKKLGINEDHRAAKAIPWIEEYFRVKLPGTWTVIGQQLRNLSIDMGLPIMKVDDPRWGQVNTYHKDTITGFKHLLDEDENWLLRYRN